MCRNSPMIRSKRWVKANMVLLGDAKATAHFSIGSGTKLAMEDAIALADAMHRAPTVDAALQQYEEGRREEVEKTQHAADVSLVWFEHVDRFWDFDPVRSEEHTSELQSPCNLVCRLLLEKKMMESLMLEPARRWPAR